METTQTREYRVKKRDWGLIVIGVLMALAGVSFIALPGITLVAITLFAGAAFLVSGVFDIISYVRFRKSMDLSRWLIVYAVFDIIIGAIFLLNPIVLAAVLPWAIGLFFVVFGIFEVVGSFRIRNTEAPLWGWMLASGLISVLCGVLFFIYPASFAIFIGIFTIVRGVSLVVYGASVDKMLVDA